ncbi:MAG: hypothetical protein P8Q36_14745 [Alphaproteobacteria bacterium]|nr:hypothetical protein [Rhodospirillaceae bacterium]MBT6203879.1 hypothetical protein [Rhodospirillaceae bacterium]MBT6512827.1 hypothetical protein [Rhodospirillaceae bacterium]MBT7615262.1 hypothetical protein [Rhodospirillaceae bacterium]MDG2482104.1 hypothetical protein [Alphaproteobacteria bacterium]
MADLAAYQAKSGRFVPVWTLEIQTLASDTDRLLDDPQPYRWFRARDDRELSDG